MEDKNLNELSDREILEKLYHSHFDENGDIQRIKRTMKFLAKSVDKAVIDFKAYNTTYKNNYGQLKKQIEDLEKRCPPAIPMQ